MTKLETSSRQLYSLNDLFFAAERIAGAVCRHNFGYIRRITFLPQPQLLAEARSGRVPRSPMYVEFEPWQVTEDQEVLAGIDVLARKEFDRYQAGLAKRMHFAPFSGIAVFAGPTFPTKMHDETMPAHSKVYWQLFYHGLRYSGFADNAWVDLEGKYRLADNPNQRVRVLALARRA